MNKCDDPAVLVSGRCPGLRHTEVVKVKVFSHSVAALMHFCRVSKICQLAGSLVALAVWCRKFARSSECAESVAANTIYEK